MYSSPLKFLYIVLFFLFCGQVMAAHSEKHTFTLVIDAGHGGHDAGAVGSFSKEKSINLAVALALGKLVEDNCPDVRVIYTRKTDVFIPLQRRADIANNAKADLFISVHTNALPNGKIAYGSETYSLGMARADENLAVAKRENSVITLESDYQRTYQGFDPNKAESYVIFEIMQDRDMQQSVDLASAIQKQYTQAGRPNKGVHQAGFLVLRNTSMPSVLTELGFITTPAEENYLNSAKGVSELSRSIYNGFLAYRRQYDKTAHDLPQNLPIEHSVQVPNTHESCNNANNDVAVVPVKAVRSNQQVKQDNSQVAPSATPKAQSAQKPKTQQQQQQRKTEQSSQSATPPAKKKNQSNNSNAQQPKAQPQQAKKKNQPTQQQAKVLYRIQVGAGKVVIDPKDPQFKGLKIERVKEGSFYKYFYGSYTTYAAAQKGLRTAQAKISGAYMVAYVGGKSVSVKEAREKEK